VRAGWLKHLARSIYRIRAYRPLDDLVDQPRGNARQGGLGRRGALLRDIGSAGSRAMPRTNILAIASETWIPARPPAFVYTTGSSELEGCFAVIDSLAIIGTSGTNPRLWTDTFLDSGRSVGTLVGDPARLAPRPGQTRVAFGLHDFAGSRPPCQVSIFRRSSLLAPR
jgi:hypothetical protein